MLCQKCGYEHSATRACPLGSRADAGSAPQHTPVSSPYPKLDKPKPEAVAALREAEGLIRELYRTTGNKAEPLVRMAKERLDFVLRKATGGDLFKCPRCNCRFSEANYWRHIDRCDSPYGSKRSKS